ncbi:uncharacterized protein [Henckelia pumila]|uniref:uncharacterized protein n=1 Tax=Henckelia pumila TaxID=405737 RepID=UPI003C6E1FC5
MIQFIRRVVVSIFKQIEVVNNIETMKKEKKLLDDRKEILDKKEKQLQEDRANLEKDLIELENTKRFLQSRHAQLRGQLRKLTVENDLLTFEIRESTQQRNMPRDELNPLMSLHCEDIKGSKGQDIQGR